MNGLEAIEYMKSGGIVKGNDTYYHHDGIFNEANYFSTKERAEEINFKQILFRKLKRFSDQNGGIEIDWGDNDQKKWFNIIDCEKDYYGFYPIYTTKLKEFGQVYFISEEVAQEAIELFRDELAKYFKFN